MSLGCWPYLTTERLQFTSSVYSTLVDPKFRAVWVKYWLDLAWPVETIALAPSAICALLACWFSRPLTRRDATALLGVYLFLIIFVPIGLKWALGPYIGPGLWFLVGVLALLSTIFFAMAYVKRVAKGDQQNFWALRDKSDHDVWCGAWFCDNALANSGTSSSGAEGCARASWADSRNQWPGAEDIDCTRQIVGEDRERHLGSDLWQRFHQEVRSPHTCFDRAEGMLHRLTPQAHRLRICVEPPLHSIQQMFILPSCDAPLRPCRALRFERALGTCSGPIAPQNLARLLVGVAIEQMLAGRATVDVLVGKIDEVLFAEATIRFCPRC